MPSLSRATLTVSAVLLALATALGAYGSHALSGRIDALALHAYDTAVHYQFFHGLGLFCVGLWLDRHSVQRSLALGLAAISTGLLLFCGGIFLPILGGPAFLGPLVPVGGLLLIGGWLICAASFMTQSRKSR